MVAPTWKEHLARTPPPKSWRTAGKINASSIEDIQKACRYAKKKEVRARKK